MIQIRNFRSLLPRPWPTWTKPVQRSSKWHLHTWNRRARNITWAWSWPLDKLPSILSQRKGILTETIHELSLSIHGEIIPTPCRRGHSLLFLLLDRQDETHLPEHCIISGTLLYGLHERASTIYIPSRKCWDTSLDVKVWGSLKTNFIWKTCPLEAKFSARFL